MLLEKIIFNEYFYSHQMVSIVIIFISCLFYFILNIIQSKLNLSCILLFLSKYNYSFSLLLIKYIHTNYYINIYLLGFIQGIFGTIFFFILFHNKIPFEILNLDNIFIIIFYFILRVIINFFFFKIISKLSPLHSQIIDYITIFISQLIFKKQKIIDNIIFGLCILSSLIYLEILILNFCDLNKNIKDNISQRGKNEIIKELINDESNIEIENYSFINK